MNQEHPSINVSALEDILSKLAEQVAAKVVTAPGAVTDSITFGELFSHYFERHVKTRLRNVENAHYFFKAHGPRWQHTPVHEITRKDLQKWVDDLAAESHASATRAVNMMSAIINWGIRRDLIPPIKNPCVGVEKFDVNSRKRFLAPAELMRFRDALLEESPLMRDFFWTCLLTGARRGNVLAMRWDEIDFDLETWTIPAEKFKTGDSHVIPLNSWVLTLLKSRRSLMPLNGSPWVFPAWKRGATGHIVEPKRAWSRVLLRGQLKDLRIHDLRRTLASYMAIHGENQYVIAQMLGHKDLRSTAVYARLNLVAVRKASGAVSDQWQNLLDKPDQREADIEAPRLPDVCQSTKLSACEQILIEAKILTSIRQGGTTKKCFYQKIGSQVKFDKSDLNRILLDMERRQLVSRFQTDAGVTHYSTFGSPAESA